MANELEVMRRRPNYSCTFQKSKTTVAKINSIFKNQIKPKVSGPPYLKKYDDNIVIKCYPQNG